MATAAEVRRSTPAQQEPQDERRTVPPSSWASAAITAEGGPNGEVRLTLRRYLTNGGTSEDLNIEHIEGVESHSQGQYTLDKWTPEMLGYFADAVQALRVAQMQVSR